MATGKLLNRAKAEALLAAVLERARIINQDPSYLYTVDRLAVFGSFLSSKEVLGDLDVAVRLAPKLSQKEQQAAEAELRDDRRFPNMTVAAFYPQKVVYSFLKGRSGHVSLHHIEELAELDCPFKELDLR